MICQHTKWSSNTLVPNYLELNNNHFGISYSFMKFWGSHWAQLTSTTLLLKDNCWPPYLMFLLSLKTSNSNYLAKNLLLYIRNPCLIKYLPFLVSSYVHLRPAPVIALPWEVLHYILWLLLDFYGQSACSSQHDLKDQK